MWNLKAAKDYRKGKQSKKASIGSQLINVADAFWSSCNNRKFEDLIHQLGKEWTRSLVGDAGAGLT